MAAMNYSETRQEMVTDDKRYCMDSQLSKETIDIEQYRQMETCIKDTRAMAAMNYSETRQEMVTDDKEIVHGQLSIETTGMVK